MLLSFLPRAQFRDVFHRLLRRSTRTEHPVSWRGGQFHYASGVGFPFSSVSLFLVFTPASEDHIAIYAVFTLAAVSHSAF